MRSYAARRRDDARTLLLINPGWVRTDLGGEGAQLTIDQSVPAVVDVRDGRRDVRDLAAALEGHAGEGVLRFLDYRGQVVPW